MKKGLVAITLAMVLLLSWVVPVYAYPGTYGSNWATSFSYKIGSGLVTAHIVAGATGDVGTLTVWESDGNINVRYNANEGWVLTSTALYIGRGITYDRAENKIPLTRQGNYNLNKFDKHEDLPQPALSDDYSMAEKPLGHGNWLCIAAYAELQNQTPGNRTYKAWADLQPVGAWKLPASPVTVRLNQYTGSDNHFFDLEISGDQLNNFKYSIEDGGIYNGWCADIVGGFDIEYNSTYSARLYSSLYLNGVPAELKSIPWDMINYIINHRNPDDSWDNVQCAIWYFTDGLMPGNNPIYYYDPENPSVPLLSNYDADAVQAIIDDANANGDGFVPGPGQVGAVIVYIPGVWRVITDEDGEEISVPFQVMCIELNAGTKCFKETSCRHDCTPGWSPCSNWEPSNWQWNQHHWNPCSTTYHSSNPKWAHKYQWNSNLPWKPTFHHKWGCK